MDYGLAGRTFVVTGAARGQGAAEAELLVGERGRVIGADILVVSLVATGFSDRRPHSVNDYNLAHDVPPACFGNSVRSNLAVSIGSP